MPGITAEERKPVGYRGREKHPRLLSASIAESAAFLDTAPLTGQERTISERIVKEVRERLRFCWTWAWIT